MNDKATQCEMDNRWGRHLTAATGRTAPNRVLGARFRSLAAVAVLAAAAGACGSDSNSDPEAVSMATPTPPVTSMNPAMTPAPAPSEETPTPSDSMPAAAGGETPMGSVPLDNPPAPADMEGSGDNEGAEGETPAPDDGAAEPPPAAEPPDEPVPSAAFNPCPTDGSACRIMALGDSITFGLGSSPPGGAYRVELFRQAVLDGHDMTFVGTNPAGFGGGGPNGPATVEGQPFPGNHDGISGDTIPGVSGRVDAAIAATDPDIILLHIGTNHLGGALPNGLLDQLGNLFDQITEDAPDALLVVAQIVPRRQGNDPTEAFNAGIPALIEERTARGDHLMLVDMYTPFVSNPAFATALLNDIVHPNDAGYAVMGQTWYDAIESFLP